MDGIAGSPIALIEPGYPSGHLKPQAGSHSRLMPDEGVGRSRGSVGTLTSFDYAHAPLAEWPEPAESACDSSMGGNWTRNGEAPGLPGSVTNDSDSTATSISITLRKQISN